MKNLAGSLFLALLFSLAAQAAPYLNQGDGYSLEPPSGWQPVDSAIAQQQLHASSAFLGPDQGDGFRAKVSVMIQTQVSVKDFEKLSLQQIAGFNGKVLNKKPLTRAGFSGGEMTWTGDVQGQKLEFHSVYFGKNGNVYLFTGTSLTAKYAAVSALLNSAGNSFKLLK